MDKEVRSTDCNRLPTLERIPMSPKKTLDKFKMTRQELTRYHKNNYVLYDNFYNDVIKHNRKDAFYTYCLISVVISFVFGLTIGIIVMGLNTNELHNPKRVNINNSKNNDLPNLNALQETGKDSKERNAFNAVSFTGIKEVRYHKEIYPKGLTEDMKEMLKDDKTINHKHSLTNVNVTHVPNDNTVLYNSVYWGPEIENAMPQGYGENTAELWEQYVDQGEVVKMESGCGRMQNRLVTFKDGLQACVRYRQNTDQIQGEIFSFYVGRLLNLTNLAPSVVKVVDVKDKLWRNVANDIATAQWNSNRAVVLTQYIPSLEAASIPDVFKPSSRHLNKIDVMKMSLKENDTTDAFKEILLDKLRNKNMKVDKKAENFQQIDMKLSTKMVKTFLELAQWSDLIIFDYLTANLDRIVNNLFNFQWNVNIMDGPAHNLARKMDSGLLLFLDNESGLLHGYRLLKKYNVYHSLMLDNLCVFRKRTIDSLKSLHESVTVGQRISDMFHKKNNMVIRDILPPLPEKNAKMLHDRIGKVLSQVEKCEHAFR